MKAFSVLGTPLVAQSASELIKLCHAATATPEPWAIDFTNTQIVTMRRHEPAFAETTSRMDCFVPDGMPLVWCMNRQGAQLSDRVYGPAFMRECVAESPSPFTHYFLGGSAECVEKLRVTFMRENPDLQVVGTHHGYDGLSEEDATLEEINRLSPDFIWVGLGTPRQQEWIHRNKDKLVRGVVLAVGFAFDVNAGTKKDSPLWMQKLGLGWLFRMVSEPARLGPRYLRYNSLFLFYLMRDGLQARRSRP